MKALILAEEEHICEALVSQFQLRGREYYCASLDELDSERSAVELLGHFNIDVVINALRFAELDTESNDTIVDTVTGLALICHQQQIPLIQLSSSRVYDGCDEGVHVETEDPVPASRQGVMLGRLEELVRGTCPRRIILRTGPIFSVVGDNLLTDLLGRFGQGGAVALADEGQGCPIHAMDLARVISAIVDQLSCGIECWGTYHYCSSDPVSYYQYGETVLAVMSQYTDIAAAGVTLEPCADVDPDWQTPLLNCEKILHTFGIKQLPWRSFIVDAVKEALAVEDEVESVSGTDDS